MDHSLEGARHISSERARILWGRRRAGAARVLLHVCWELLLGSGGRCVVAPGKIGLQAGITPVLLPTSTSAGLHVPSRNTTPACSGKGRCKEVDGGAYGRKTMRLDHRQSSYSTTPRLSRKRYTINTLTTKGSSTLFRYTSRKPERQRPRRTSGTPATCKYCWGRTRILEVGCLSATALVAVQGGETGTVAVERGA